MADGVPDTETAILDAALAEVLEHGIRRTTASDIARRCGIARQTLYRYWPDAQAVFAALVTRELVAALPRGPGGRASASRGFGAEPHWARASASRGSGAEPHWDNVEDIGGLVAELVDTADRIRRMPLVDRLRDTDPELFARYILDRLGTSQRTMHAELVGVLATGQDAGFVREGDPVQLAAMVLLIVQSAVQSAPLVAEWLPAAAWQAELTQALRGYLGAAA